MSKEEIKHILDELIKEAEENPDWKAVNALRCAEKELLKNEVKQMNKEEVLESIIKAITLIEDNPQKYLVYYVIYDALCNARDYLMLDS